jgi:hypothetical protein
MADEDFDRWHHWSDRVKLRGLQHAGVYVLAVSGDDLQRKPFSWLPEVAYVGMTNSLAGLIGRLKQFDSTILARPDTEGRSAFDTSTPSIQNFASNFSSVWHVSRAT